MIGEGTYVDANATLEAAMPIFDRLSERFIPVVSLTGKNAAPELRGGLFQVDALKAYNRAGGDGGRGAFLSHYSGIPASFRPSR